MALTVLYQPKSIDFARNNLVVRVKSSLTPPAGADHYVLVNISMEIMYGAGTVSIPEFRVHFNASGIADVRDFGQIAMEYFRRHPVVPPSAVVPQVLPSPFITCLMSFTDVVDGQESGELSLGPWRLINGRVNASEYPGFDLRSKLSAVQGYLSNSPDNIYTYKGAEHFLYFLNPGSGNAQVRVVMYGDGDLDGDRYESPLVSLGDGEVLVVPVSRLIGELPVEPSYVEVQVVTDSGSVIGRPKTFWFNTPELYSRTLLFLNRYGVFDTVTGVTLSNKFAVKDNAAVRSLPPDYLAQAGDYVQDDASEEDSFEFETGPVTMEMAQHYKELIASRSAYLQVPGGWVRVLISAGNVSIFDDEKDLQTVKLKYSPAFSDDHINHSLVLPEVDQEDYSMEYLKTDYK